MNDKILMLGILVLCLGFMMQYTSLHNVDLSWNAKHLDKVDDNGMTKQDIGKMYNRSMLYLLGTPFIFVIGLSLIFMGFRYESSNK